MKSRAPSIAVVTGGRDVLPNAIQLFALDAALTLYGITAVRCGGARDVDTICYAHLGARAELWPAAWDRLGRGAGHARNRAMLLGEPANADCPKVCATYGTRASLLIAFPGGNGTADCIRTAAELGIEIVRIL